MVAKKTKLTLNVDRAVLKEAKKVSQTRNIPVSRLVETYLKFLSDPMVWCFKCGEGFEASKTDVCAKCSYLICPKCKACGCKLGEETSVAVFHMRKVYEHLLGGRLK